MSTLLDKLRWIVACMIFLGLMGCRSAPHSFIDAQAHDSESVGRDYRAMAQDQRLIIVVTQTPGFNVAGFDVFEQDGSLYVTPRHVSSGGGGTARFEIGLSRFPLRSDWPEHVYWILQSYAYPAGHPGFWSKERRSPWVRKKMEVKRE